MNDQDKCSRLDCHRAVSGGFLLTGLVWTVTSIDSVTTLPTELGSHFRNVAVGSVCFVDYDLK